jgi:hypothetical protein
MKWAFPLTWLAVAAMSPGHAAAKDCRVPHVAAKYAVKPPSGCDLPARSDEAVKLKQQNGFVDLGNGTQVRIGGRVRMDTGIRR